MKSRERDLEEWERGTAHSEAQKGEVNTDRETDDDRVRQKTRLGATRRPKVNYLYYRSDKGPEGAYSKMASRNSP